jgi:uncharacterized protein Usg
MIIFRQPTLVTVDVIYYPPQSLLLQEFIWQTDDIIPELPRIRRFLAFWKSDIGAVIQQVLIAESSSNFKPVDFVELY